MTRAAAVSWCSSRRCRASRRRRATRPYGAAKAGLMSLVRTRRGRAGAVGRSGSTRSSPGVVWTPRVCGLLGDEGKASQSRERPLRRVAYPADIAAGLLFLASDLSRYVTGQTLVVDGGVSAKFPFGTGLHER